MPAPVVDHVQELQRLTQSLDAPAAAVTYHYVRAAFIAEGRCVAATAKRLGMHRRTVQRMLQATKPTPKVPA